MTEEEYSIVYDRDTLLKQLLDRYESGISRYYAVKKHGMVVASCSSYGETEDLAIVGGVIVHKDFHRLGLAKDVEQHICTDLRNEGKSCISFVNYDNAPSLALHNKLGGTIYSSYNKFSRR